MQKKNLVALLKVLETTAAGDPLNTLAMAILDLDDQRAAEQIALKRTIVELERKFEKGQAE
jgi:hypothetical protein